MSAPVVISLASAALRRLIWEHGFAPLANDGGPLQSENDIALSNPVDATVDENVRFSLWLYRVVESPYVKNASLGFTGRDAPRNGNGPSGARLAYPPLTLNLHYLLTPLGGTEEARQLVLGHAMVALHDHAIAVRHHAEHAAPLPLVVAGDDGDQIPLTHARRHQTTSEARFTILVNPFFLSSRATAPKTRVPLGLLSSPMMTTAFESKRT